MADCAIFNHYTNVTTGYACLKHSFNERRFSFNHLSTLLQLVDLHRLCVEFV
jgi:hypothetical protein